MGYGFYVIGGRPCGYMVIATCDRRGCERQIDRGLGYLCGGDSGAEPGRPGIDAGPGCHRYYCAEHGGFVGPRGGCKHPRSSRAWGRTLSDMVPNPEGDIVCLDPVGHPSVHAWAVTQPPVGYIGDSPSLSRSPNG